MTELDEKLREILNNMVDDGTLYGEISPGIDRAVEQAIAQIKQAFADEGYVKPLFKNVSMIELKSDPKYNPDTEEEK